MRVGVNSGEAVVREIGGAGHVAYPAVGDTVNTGARLESLAPPGGVLIGEETYERLPDGTVVEPWRELRIKGKDDAGHRIRPAGASLARQSATRRRAYVSVSRFNKGEFFR